MANIFDGFLNQVATGDQIKDRQHASRLYVANNYALSPKYNWLYHVYFELNDELSSIRVEDKLIEYNSKINPLKKEELISYLLSLNLL